MNVVLFGATGMIGSRSFSPASERGNFAWVKTRL